MTCEVCGSPVAGNPRGRPKQYCGAACREYTKREAQLIRALDAVQFADGIDGRRRTSRIRSRLFAIANLLNRYGVPVEAFPGRPPEKNRNGWRGLRLRR